MSLVLPLFPLSGVVLLPGTLLPLYIFEPRYRALVADALAGSRTIGIAMLKRGWEEQGSNPPIHAVGGGGEIVESEKLDDGRYNILLVGRFRYRVLGEEPAAAPYRIARVEEVASLPFFDVSEEERACRAATRLFDRIREPLELPPVPRERLSSERLASEIALRLRYAPEELQALLETDSVSARFGTLMGRMREWRRRMEFLAPFRPAQLDVRRN